MKALILCEWRIYFLSLSTYIFFGLYYALGSFLFLASENYRSFSGYFAFLTTISMGLGCVLTARSFARDEETGVDALLLSAPLDIWELILGKYVGALVPILFFSVGVFDYAIALSFFSNVSWTELLGQFFGMALALSFFVAFALFCSSLTQRVSVAIFYSFSGFMVFLFLRYMGGLFSDQALGEWLQALSFLDHTDAFFNGISTWQDLGYLAMGSWFWLFLTKVRIESRNFS